MSASRVPEIATEPTSVDAIGVVHERHVVVLDVEVGRAQRGEPSITDRDRPRHRTVRLAGGRRRRGRRGRRAGGAVGPVAVAVVVGRRAWPRVVGVGRAATTSGAAVDEHAATATHSAATSPGVTARGRGRGPACREIGGFRRANHTTGHGPNATDRSPPTVGGKNSSTGTRLAQDRQGRSTAHRWTTVMPANTRRPSRLRPSGGRGRVRRLLPHALVVSFAAALLATAASPAPAGAVADDDWVGIVNTYRAMSGLDPIVANGTWSAQAQAHSCYMLLNGISHDEVPGRPGYTIGWRHRRQQRQRRRQQLGRARAPATTSISG